MLFQTYNFISHVIVRNGQFSLSIIHFVVDMIYKEEGETQLLFNVGCKGFELKKNKID